MSRGSELGQSPGTMPVSNSGHLPGQTLAQTFGWAAYLACSWTWCIGMFLPVLLIRDFGMWGFVVFAVPNVIGAAAMGWVLTKPASERIVAQHRAAIRAFGSVTVAFQVFFGLWLAAGGPLGTLDGLAGSCVRGMIALGLVCGAASKPHLLPGVFVWVLSLSTLGWFASAADPVNLAAPVAINLLHLVPLAAVCLFGFVLCPYLDGTFHLALQQAARPRAAFSLGFGVLFLLMILGTVLYAPAGSGHAAVAVTVASWLASVHIGVQLAFTIHEHIRSGIALAPTRGVEVPFRGLAIGVAVLAVAVFWQFGDPLIARLNMTFGEVAYRLFMAAYGLLFPAYVLLCMIPLRGAQTSSPSRDTLRVWLFACGIAAPMYWMGFIERQTWWLLPGVAVVLVARLALRWRGPTGERAAMPASTPG